MGNRLGKHINRGFFSTNQVKHSKLLFALIGNSVVVPKSPYQKNRFGSDTGFLIKRRYSYRVIKKVLTFASSKDTRILSGHLCPVKPRVLLLRLFALLMLLHLFIDIL